jgi:diadenosine tetraphosphate (Ap4A) HIT family hydrolase
MFERYQMDSEAYDRRAQTQPCFICKIIAGKSNYPEHILYQDEVAIAFLDKYPRLYGYTLVAPLRHREQASGDFSLDEYLELQRRVYWVAEAVRQEVGAERVYFLSLGSNQGNSHVHWHIAPFPPGVAYRQQQLAAIMQDPLRIPEEEQAGLAARLQRRVAQLRGDNG